jgi:outer membrane protein assembly factor BamB
VILSPGDNIAGYIVEQLLGIGGFGEVYKVRNPLMEETFALKILSPEAKQHDPSIPERFKDEIKILLKLNHPRIVRIFHAGYHDDLPFFVMEYLPLSLADLIGEVDPIRRDVTQPFLPEEEVKRTLSLQEAMRIAEQLIEVLRYIHERGLVHGDLKPSNILLREKGSLELKLCDFGIARILGRNFSTLSMRGAFGTPIYSAPEVIRGERDVDQRADIYSVGVILYRVLTGDRPVGYPKPLERWEPPFPKEVSDAVMRAMSAERRDRFGSVRELEFALSKVSCSTPEPDAVRVGEDEEIAVKVRNDGYVTVRDLWVGLDILSPEGGVVECTRTGIPHPDLGVEGRLEFVNQGMDLSPGEERVFVARYRFDEGLKGHRYGEGDYRYRYGLWAGVPGGEGSLLLGEIRESGLRIERVTRRVIKPKRVRGEGVRWKVERVDREVAPGVRLLWKAYVGRYNKAFTCHPLIFGDRIYHASNGDEDDKSDPYDRLYCFSADGRLLWSFRSRDGGNTDMNGVVACPDFVVVGCDNGYVYALSHDGKLIWKFKTGGGVKSFSIGDVDGDGEMEVLVGSWDDNVYCIGGEGGQVKWKVKTGNWVVSSPALGDVDGDGEVEVVVGSWDNNVYCIGGEGGQVKWKVKTGGDVDSSPALGDVDGDGEVEVVVGSDDNNIYCIEGENGKVKWKVETGDDVQSSPALGDVDGDGEVEVVVGSEDDNVYCIDGGSGWVKWKVYTGGSVLSSPVLGDVDGDGEVEVVVGSVDDNIYCIGGESGQVKWKVETGYWVDSSPALGDVDGDGRVEIAVASFDGWLYLLRVEKPCGEILWARWHGDGFGTGLLGNAVSYGEAAARGETDIWTPS